MFASLLFQWAVHFILVLVHIAGLVVFLKGFFPSKIALPGFSTFDNKVSPFTTAKNTAHFDKFVFMVVDAMRADFMFLEQYSNMPFLHELVTKGDAVPFTAFSNPPTVTLPRLKGITTGGAPSFLDAILNVADDNDQSQGLGSQDSWVRQFLHQNKSIHFFGDDTWLKLFPDQFDAFEGTNSFFVSDFTEVDNNVTRHLDVELRNKNWDGLILHYLGLDHIGHKGGPDSVFMRPKQREMDDILARLYQHISQNDDTLLVLMGDHGMNEIGNHGGSSAGETSAGLTLISPKFKKFNLQNSAPVPDTDDYSYFSKISQIDLVPTLSYLLNLPIPKNSLGVIIREFLLLGSLKQQKQVLQENSDQLMQLFTAKYGTEDHAEIIESYANLTPESHVADYYQFLLSAQQLLASSATNYNYEDIYTGYGLVLVSSVVLVAIFNYYLFKTSQVSRSVIVYFEGFIVLYSLHFHGSSLIEEEYQIWWFCTISSLLAYMVSDWRNIKKNAIYYVLLSASLRAMRAWNNSGQKFSSKVTVASYLLNENPNLLWSLIVFTYLLFSLSVWVQGGFNRCLDFLNFEKGTKEYQQMGSFLSFLVIFITSSLSFLFKICQFYNDGHVLPPWIKWLFNWIVENYNLDLDSIQLSDNDAKFKLQEIIIELSQMSGWTILCLLGFRIVVGKIRGVKKGLFSDIVNISTFFLLQQTRFENIPMFIAFYIIRYSFTKILVNLHFKKLNVDQFIIIISVFVICLQNLAFFSLGSTNSLATVDLSNAYNGIKSYDVILVGLLTFISNYSGAIFWSFSSLQMLFESYNITFEATKEAKNLVYMPELKKTILLIKSRASLLFYSVGAVNLIGSCINLRFHLFIWTVFSPKLLYFGAWSVFMNLVVDLLVAFVVLFVF